MMEVHLSGERPLILVAGASIALSSDGRLICTVGDLANELVGADPELVRGVLARIDGTRTAEQVVSALAADARPAARQVLSTLFQIGIVGEQPIAPEPRHERVVLIGNHLLLAALDESLAANGFQNRCRVLVSSFESVEAGLGRVIGPPPRLAPGAFDRKLERASVADLASLIAEFDLVIAAVEGQPYQALLDVNRAASRASKPCLVVTPTVVGPYVRGGAGPCFECWLHGELGVTNAMPWLLAPHTAPGSALEAVARVAAARVTVGDVAASVVRMRDGSKSVEQLLSNARCTACAPTPDEPLASAAASAIELARIWPLTPITPSAEPAPHPDAYRTVGIVGGGTAGYLTALALRRHRPELEVTLIESSAIPVIGVGEATTPEIVRMLHSAVFLGKDIHDFHMRVRPTWKLGIKFEFGTQDYFTFPFQRGRILESHLYDGHMQNQSLGAMLMAADKSPVIRDERGRVTNLDYLVRGAYHLENRRFVRYLGEEARKDGVKHIDAKIAEVRRSADGENVTELVTDDGRRLAFDMYIDCSGFRSLLLEGALQSPYYDWSSTLFTDRAVAAPVPHDGTVKPYTLAETMDAGWCWNIPFEDEDHRGYVFSSRFMSADQAEAEMRAKNPAMGEAALIRFRSGRHEHFWKGNTLAIGNAYGFVEPLESTAIHMMVLTLELLTTHFPISRHDTAIRDTLNRKIGRRWDALRWFLGIHYRFNGRLDTPFWRAARADCDVSGAEEAIALYRERAPLSYRASQFYTLFAAEFFSDDHSFDTLLMGLGVKARYLEPVVDPETWKRRRASLLRTASAALPQAEALPWLREHPEELNRLISEPLSFVHRSLPA